METANKKIARKIILGLLDNPNPPSVALVTSAVIRRFAGDMPTLSEPETLTFDEPLSVLKISDKTFIVCKI